MSSRDFLGGLLGGGDSGGFLGGVGGGDDAPKATASPSPNGGAGGGFLGGLSGGAGGGAGSGIEGIITGVASNLISQAVQGQGPLGGIVSGLADAAGPAANALGSGLGMGTIKGLKLQSMMNMPMVQPNVTGFSGLAMNLGEGLSSSLFSNLNTSSIATPDTINKAVEALGSGLGNGTAVGIARDKAGSTVPPKQTGIPRAAGNLGYGLTTGLFSNLDLQSSGLMTQLGKVPGPAGKGLGEGAVQALRAQIGQSPSLASRAVASTASKASMGASGFDVAQASEDFTKSLSSSFLQGMTISALMSPQFKQGIINAISQAAGPAGKGLGTGGAAGLKRLMQAMRGGTGTSDPPPLAGNNQSLKLITVLPHPHDRMVRGLSRRQTSPGASAFSPVPGSVGEITIDFTSNLAENFVGNLDVSGITNPAM